MATERPVPGQLTRVPAPGVLQKLEEQEQQAQRLKEKLRSKQQSLQQQLEQLQGLPRGGERDRPRADSLDSSVLSSERSDSDQGECCGMWAGFLVGFSGQHWAVACGQGS